VAFVRSLSVVHPESHCVGLWCERCERSDDEMIVRMMRPQLNLAAFETSPSGWVDEDDDVFASMDEVA
jgi:hypothetical protein